MNIPIFPASSHPLRFDFMACMNDGTFSHFSMVQVQKTSSFLKPDSWWQENEEKHSNGVLKWDLTGNTLSGRETGRDGKAQQVNGTGNGNNLWEHLCSASRVFGLKNFSRPGFSVAALSRRREFTTNASFQFLVQVINCMIKLAVLR
jgi:hypothetical protein